MTRQRRSRRGFATVMALVCLFLVGVTSAGLMTHMSMQARRTAREADRAQQEQIVIARSLGGDVKLPDQLRFLRPQPKEDSPRRHRGHGRGKGEENPKLN